MALKRNKAARMNPAPRALMIATSPHTTLRPAPRYKTAWANLTKCVDGETYIAFCRNTGMLSNGVKLPESRNITTNTGIDKSANYGIELATVARRMPSEHTA